VDPELVRQAQRGSEQAFASIAVAIGDRLHGLAQRILRDQDLAEDATQQALFAIWRDLPRLRDVERFDGWSYRLLVNACYGEARKRRRGPVPVAPPRLHSVVADDVSGAVINRDQLERGFRRLSMDHRAVVAMYYYLDLSPEQIGETLGVPAGTVRSRLHHGIRGLRAALDADERNDPGRAAR
jgi:RNA polymerase sigma-70 factor (ECF subfamily)